MTLLTQRVTSLGVPRAEADSAMLQRAFVETADFKALTATTDFNFVVGRRGTGKTALFLRTADTFRTDKQCFLHAIKPEEHDVIGLQALLSHHARGYDSVRALSRVMWRAHLLLRVLGDVLRHWKIEKYADISVLRMYQVKFGAYTQASSISSCSNMLRALGNQTDPNRSMPGELARLFDVGALEAHLNEALKETGSRAAILFDGLDEGWQPSAEATALLGGLAQAASDLADHNSDIHVTLFLRDNIFRALAHFDRDFSRHVEGSTLRLQWTEASLLHLVGNRLRVQLGLESTESDIRVWNRFAQRDLADRDGFASCLRHTLFRPRDLLVLLNKAAMLAAREGRLEIVPEDIGSTAREISQARLADLLKEYDEVFPGLELFVGVMAGQPALMTLGVLIERLDSEVASHAYTEQRASDFALLGDGAQVAAALYSVGFVGLEDSSSGRYSFCHDGAPTGLDTSSSSRRIMLHPCYWEALGVLPADVGEDALSAIYDDHEERPGSEARDLRTKQLGQIVERLPRLAVGKAGWKDFEEWVLRALKILFSGTLSNFEAKPNSQKGLDRRDIVARNDAKSGFWKRVLDDFGSRQIVVEVKNYSELTADDFRQVADYATGAYGKFVLVITRASSEAVGETERDWIRKTWKDRDRLVFIVGAEQLAKCIRKLRNVNRFDYPENVLNKRLDRFQRWYVEDRHK